MSGFRLAFSFLTIVPTYGNRVAGEKEMANSLYSYPVVGFIIGGFLAALAWLSNYLALGWGGDGLIIVSWIIITGGLHLDGLMDSADGLFSGRDRDHKLEIMKDSRVGAMGGIALASLILLKFSFVASLPYSSEIWALLIAPAVGRCFMVYAVSLFPNARSGPSLGKSFGAKAGKAKIVGATLVLVTGVWLADQLTGLLLVTITALLVAIIALWINRTLGGQTGDTYGAICELSETIFLIAAAVATALSSHGWI